MWSKFRSVSLFALISIFCVCTAQASEQREGAPSVDKVEPDQIEEDLGEIMQANLVRLIGTFGDETLTDEARLETVGDIVAFRSITRGVLGKHRSKLSKQQQQAFQGEFQKSMLSLLGTALKNAGDYDIEIRSVKKRDARRAQVLGVVRTPKGGSFDLLSSVGRSKSGWKVRNLTVDGVNLGLTYRNQFDELMKKNQGDVDATIAEWASSSEPK